MHGIVELPLKCHLDLQQQYTNYKNNLQQLAQRIGDIEQDTEEHKSVNLGCLDIRWQQDSPLRLLSIQLYAH